MDILTKDKDMKKHLKKAIKDIKKSEERHFSEYEIRLLIHDEISCHMEVGNKLFSSFGENTELKGK